MDTNYPTNARRQARSRALLSQLRKSTKRELVGLVMELAARCYAQGIDARDVKVNGPKLAHEVARDIARSKQEQLVGLYLDAQNGLLAREQISLGSLNTTRTHPREMLRPAILHNAVGFILCHNHPSGSLDPSPEDVEFTRSVKRAGELIGVELYDHLIIARDGYTSLRERGLL